MIVRDTSGLRYRLTNKLLYEIKGGSKPSPLRYAIDLHQFNEAHYYVTSYFYDMRADRSRFVNKSRFIYLGIWPIEKRGWIFPKVVIGCRTFRGDYARAILRAAKDA